MIEMVADGTNEANLICMQTTKDFSSARLYNAECAFLRSQTNILSSEIDKTKTVHGISESLF